MTINSKNSLQKTSEKIFENRKAEQWMSTAEAAIYLRISTNALRILVCRGRVKYFKFGRNLRFNLSDLNALMSKGA